LYSLLLTLLHAIQIRFLNLQAGGHRFDPGHVHQPFSFAVSALLPRSDGVRSSGTLATSKLACIPQVTIGRTSYRNLPVRVQPTTSAGILANPAVDGILGSDFLKQFVTSLDLGKNSLYLNTDHNFRLDRDRFSTIGIQFAKNPTGFFNIMAVWSPTPASEANINVGDQILSVDGLTTVEMTQGDLSRQLHGEPG
jgi:hypothetical protein